ncbi:penicillin-binding protein activator [Tepidicaulis sp. LMO-SS28]|uniref:penicillin-binding protein activator n=1 Tax=Tepidicaulis sp. LMO-SS28 TaxID=3447455 RepID=UPI003EE1470C
MTAFKSAPAFLRHASLLFLLLAMLGLAACASQPRPAETQKPAETPVAVTPPPDDGARDESQFLTPPHMEGKEPVRVALLLPMGASQKDVRQVAQALSNAAQMALFEMGNADILLMPKDTRGTGDGAASAAEEALREGADIILGPLFAHSVQGAAPVARRAGVPMIAFSTDRHVAGNGVYLLSFLPEENVTRVIDYAGLQGYESFAGFLPQTGYGERVRNALVQAVSDRALKLDRIESYPADTQAMFQPARRLARYDARRDELRAEKARREAAGDEAGVRRLEDRDTFGDVPFDAVLVAAGGQELKSVAPLLPYFDVDPRKVKFLGTGLWDDPSAWNEPTISGGWYAAPPLEAREAFSSRYRSYFSARPPLIASLAYDAVSLTSALARAPGENDFAKDAFLIEDGFSGVDGIFRFLPDGTNERGLAVFEVRSSGPVMIDPAPTSFRPQAF